MLKKSLWKCPSCGREFANCNQWHSCGSFTVEEHLQDKSSDVISLYERLVQLAEQFGPVNIDPTKTWIEFRVRTAFATVVLRKNWLTVSVILPRRLKHRRFTKVESYPPGSHVHHLRIETLEELNEKVTVWLQEAYEAAQ